MPAITTATINGAADVTPVIGPSLQAALERAIASVPPEQRGKVELRVTLEGVEVDAAVRLFRGVDASAFWQRRAGGKQAAGARLRWSF